MNKISHWYKKLPFRFTHGDTLTLDGKSTKLSPNHTDYFEALQPTLLESKYVLLYFYLKKWYFISLLDSKGPYEDNIILA